MPALGILLKLLPIVALTFGLEKCSDEAMSRGDDRQIDSTLDLTGIGIENLPDGFINDEFLTKLILDKNRISFISPEAFSLAPKLEYLSLADNLLDLDFRPFSKLPNLKTLILNGNCRRDINSSYYFRERQDDYWMRRYEPSQDPCELHFDTVLPSLTHLHVENNDISLISMVGSGKLPSLTHLHISHYHHRIRRIEDPLALHKVAPALTHLFIQHSNISIFDLVLPLNVTSLYLDGNDISRIRDLYVRSMNYMETLSLSRNKIETIRDYELQNATKLITLDLSHNQITNVEDGVFNNLTLLKYLNLEGNKISNIDSSAFEQTTNLVTLDLSYNQITNIEDRVFDKLTLLKYLNLERNKISDIGSSVFEHTTNLVTLDLSHNRIREIPKESVFRLLQLEFLDLENNFVGMNILDEKHYYFPHYLSPKSLSLGNNGILSLRSENLGNLLHLTKLTLDNNRISSIDRRTFSDFVRLEELSLAGNRLTDIPSHSMPRSGSLLTLNLNSNSFTRTENIPLRDMPNLVSLFLGNNSLEAIHTGWLADAPENLTIDLGNNVSIVVTSVTRKRRDRFPDYE